MIIRYRIADRYLLIGFAAFVAVEVADAWTTTKLYTSSMVTARTERSSRCLSSYSTSLEAKRNRKQKDNPDEDMYSWYESVDADATPEDVFWNEMERQTQLSKMERPATDKNTPVVPAWTSSAVAPNVTTTPAPAPMNVTTTATSVPAPAVVATSPAPSPIPASAAATAQLLNPVLNPPFVSSQSRQSQKQQSKPLYKALKSVDSVLSEYAAYAVADNWLDENLVLYMRQQQEEQERQRQRNAMQRLDDGTQQPDSPVDAAKPMSDLAYRLRNTDPWADFGESDDVEQDRIKMDLWDKGLKTPNPYLFDPERQNDAAELAEAAHEEAVLQERLSKIQSTSPSLERARNNPQAKAFFEREPDPTEGCNRMWVSAIDNACIRNLKGTFRNYGVDFACNFGDFEDVCLEDGFVSIEDMTSYKARKVFEVTGLPCIACRTSFEIEPIPTGLLEFGSQQRAPNARVASGYRFNDIGLHVDKICDAMRPLSEPTRVTEFKTCLCYYDGEMEVYDYGTLECDLHFAHSLRTYIPVAQAVNEMLKTLELTFGLEYMPWLKTKYNDEITNASTAGTASIKLRDRVLKEGRVLPNNIIDVSAFMDSMVDVDLMDECAKELASRCIRLQPTKILTVATTGLVIALPMAKYLGVGVVYARKERNMVMADTYNAGYSSKTVGKNRELLVSTKHLEEDDRILIVDDFLSSGSSQEALLRIVSESGATAVGVAVLLEKMYESGRQSLSGYDVPIESLCSIVTVQDGSIQLLEEEGYNLQKSL
jgi:xanthine phosphoribosyltransferase